MTEEQIKTIFEPVITDALARLQKRTKANGDDVARIFRPLFESVKRAAGGGEAVIAEQLASWDPDEVNEARIYAAVRDIVNAAGLDAARRRQAELEAEMASVRREDYQLPPVGHERN